MNKVLIKDIPINDRPRERFIQYGKENISNEELISILLNNGTKDISVKNLSENILKEIDDISDLKNITLNKLTSIKGIGNKKAITLLSAIELGKRVYYYKNESKIKLDSAKKIYDYMKYDLTHKSQEYFYVLYLDTKKNLIEKKLLFIGTINKSIVHPREIFKYSYILSASSVICVHNHPSGDTLPSKEDIKLTNNLKEISSILGIQFTDHIIIGDNYYSFYENGDI